MIATLSTQDTGEASINEIGNAMRRNSDVTNGDVNNPRFLLQDCGHESYEALMILILKIPKYYQKTFPQEIVRNIANFFTTAKLDPEKSRALSCSSTSGQHNLDQCLVDSENSWWISAPNSLLNGQGEEWIEFELGTTFVRLSAVHINIPPLPRGPLSVRTMRIDASNNPTSDDWKPVSPVLVVENRSGWQRIALPTPFDVRFIRLVCLSNQASRFLVSEVPPPFNLNAVGFFTVRFE